MDAAVDVIGCVAGTVQEPARHDRRVTDLSELQEAGMKTVGAYEAKTHFSQLLEEVAAGATVTITKHGVPVSVLAPPNAVGKRSPADAVEAVKAFRRKHKLRLDGSTIKEMIEEGRR